ncbi:MAG: ribosome recycling factor [Thermoleophilia bacterium]|nr:ribosome recycling factor [Thermoleophilia bacterium]
MIDDVLKSTRERMEKTVASTRQEFTSLRTGRANPALLDRVVVNYYGAPTPLRQLASIGAPEPRLLTVTPFDKSIFKDIERAIAEAELGFNPSNDGVIIRLPVPELTEDRRKEMVKLAKKMAEEGRIALRNVRRDAISDLKKVQDAGDASEDQVRDSEKDIQKITDEHVASIDDALKSKEAEVMEV